MDKTSTTFLPNNMLGFGSMAHSAGLVELAVTLCLNQRKELCPHVWVPILKPQRPCLRAAPVPGHALSSDMLRQALLTSPSMSYFLDEMDDDELLTPIIKNKRVVFADSKGLSLTAVRLFSEAEEQRRGGGGLGPVPSIQDLGTSMTDVSYSCTVSTCCPGTQLKLGFPQPSADFQAFRAKLAESMVTLENCTVSDLSIQGTVRVRNVSFKKDVCARVTFNSWQSYKDVPCTYLEKRYGGPQTDIFEFDIPIPKVVDAKKKIEFCLRYLPGGHSTPFWDNNGGQNYSIHVSVNSHLCRGKSQRESA